MPSPTYRCRIASLQVQGFKCYANSVYLGGLQLGNGLTCVIGPNGCGKSVLGDAIAFVLGGNKKMLRANTLTSLMNQALLTKPSATARVTLELRAATADGQDISVLVQRTLSWQDGCKSETRIKVLGSNSSSILSEIDSQWQSVSHAELQQHLMTYGINNRVVDRYVVAQQSQAVAVADPLALLQHLEILLGTDHLAVQLSTCEQHLDSAASEAMQLEEQQKMLAERKKQLAPMVARWVQQNEDEAALIPRKTEHLQQAVRWLEWAVQSSRVEESKLKHSVEQAENMLQQTTDKCDEVNAMHQTVTTGLTQARARLVTVNTQVEQAIAEVSKLKGQVKAGRTAVTQRRRRLDTLRQQLPGMESAVGVASQAAELIQKSQADANKDVTLRKEQVRHATVALQKATNEKRNDKLSNSASAVQRATLQLSEAESDMEKYKVNLEGNVQRVRACEEAVIAAQKTVAKCREEVRTAEQCVTTAKAECAKCEEHIHPADQQVKEAEAVYMEAQVRVQLAKTACTTNPSKLQPSVASKVKQGSKHASQRHTNKMTDTMDQTIENLVQKSELGLLPGQFHGRMHSIFSLVDEQCAVAVNTAMSTVCNLRSTVAVSDRDTAIAVISHIAAEKAGIVTCKVTSELEVWRGQQQEVASAIECAKALCIEKIHLPSLCQANVEFEQAQAEALLSHLLGNWYVVPDRDSAQKLIAVSLNPRSGPQKPVVTNGRNERFMPRINIVTRNGELFRADGEIVASDSSSSSRSSGSEYQRYNLKALGTERNENACSDKGSKSITARSAHARHNQDVDKNRQDVEQILEKELKEAEEACRDAAQCLTAVKLQQKERHEESATANSRLLKCMQELAAVKKRLGNAVKEADAALHKVEVTKKSANALKMQTDKDVASQQVKIKGLKQELENLKEAYQNLLAKQQKKSGQELVDPQQLHERLCGLQQQLQSAQRRCADVNTQLRQAVANSKTASARYNELKNECGYAQTALEDAEQAVAATNLQLQQSSDKLLVLQQQCAERQQEVQELTASEESLGAEVKQLQDAKETCSNAVKQSHDLLHKAQAKSKEFQACFDDTRQQLADYIATHAVPAVPGAASDMVHTTGIANELPDEDRSRQASGCRVRTGSTSEHLPAGSVSQPRRCRNKRRAVSLSNGTKQANDDEMRTDDKERLDVISSDEMVFARPADVSSQPLKCAASDINRSSGSEHANPIANTKPTEMAGHSTTSQSKRSHKLEQRNKRNTRSGQKDNNRKQEVLSNTTNAMKVAAPAAVKQTRDNSRQKRNRKVKAVSRDHQTLVIKEPCREETLTVEKEAIMAEEARLAEERRMINPSDIEEDQSISQQLLLVSEQLETVEKRQEQLRQQLEQLITERFDKMCTALQAITARLSAVYSFLTGNHGDAYLGFALEKRLLFAQGVTLHVRPDAQHWRPFTALSGGQQALASLALSFAMQEALGSPFVFLDEVDCALDTHCAARVAEYMASGGVLPAGSSSKPAEAKPTTTTQYIVVSHRPQVFERASRLIGVYSTTLGVSDAVALRC